MQKKNEIKQVLIAHASFALGRTNVAFMPSLDSNPRNETQIYPSGAGGFLFGQDFFARPRPAGVVIDRVM